MDKISRCQKHNLYNLAFNSCNTPLEFCASKPWDLESYKLQALLPHILDYKRRIIIRTPPVMSMVLNSDDMEFRCCGKSGSVLPIKQQLYNQLLLASDSVKWMANLTLLCQSQGRSGGWSKNGNSMGVALA